LTTKENQKSLVASGIQVAKHGLSLVTITSAMANGYPPPAFVFWSPGNSRGCPRILISRTKRSRPVPACEPHAHWRVPGPAAWARGGPPSPISAHGPVHVLFCQHSLPRCTIGLRCSQVGALHIALYNLAPVLPSHT
jgi:hypothetical protein